MGPWQRLKLAICGGEEVIRIQFMSDLHLEVADLYNTFEIPRVAPILLLAGDVGRFSSYEKLLGFFQRQCEVFERVFYVLGNHEYYGLTPQQCLASAKQLEAEPSLIGKLTLLNRTRIDLGTGITILGCTLWSHVPEESKDIVRAKVNDFKGRISGWTVEDHNAEHEKDLLWLRSEIEQLAQESPSRSVLIATHHAPSVLGTSSERDSKNAWSPAFATELIDGIIRTWRGYEMISYWVFGHTHYCCDNSRWNLKLLANQRGYFPIEKSLTASLKTKDKVLCFDSKRYIAIASKT